MTEADPLLRSVYQAAGGGPAGPVRVTVAGATLAGDALAGAVGALAARLAGRRRVAVIAERRLGTVVAVAGALAAGVEVVPVNPRSGPAERDRLLAEAKVDAVLAPDDVDLAARADLPAPPGPDAPGLVVYTSGTTGPPKGAVLPARALAACLDGLADAWCWQPDDALVHALPLFHVHGLVLGCLGPLRWGTSLVHPGRFDPGTLAEAVRAERGRVVFAVPTMWGRIARDGGPAVAAALSGTRLLVSGSAALPRPVYDAVLAGTGRPLRERYGLTECLIVTAARADARPAAGTVGTAIRGATVRVVGEDGVPVPADGTTLGDVLVGGRTLFDGYLDRPEATAAALTPDGLLRTGDLAMLDPDGALRIVGRRSVDLIKSGGFKIGAGEVEAALLSHPSVREAAVVGEPDDDLGERVVAYVVTDTPVAEADLVAHVAARIAPHKRPRQVRFVAGLPYNDMGKVVKSRLR